MAGLLMGRSGSQLAFQAAESVALIIPGRGQVVAAPGYMPSTPTHPGYMPPCHHAT